MMATATTGPITAPAIQAWFALGVWADPEADEVDKVSDEVVEEEAAEAESC